ncbi:acetylornithine deacetylase [Martelella soudanensis]|uniref:acetylornithine deacetylase n=1 Tax=unclassified Martelella TaxID=2629616 RepID=UPI0015DF310F|nr:MULTISPECIES: acetylornithine deacetylase [unclassified Martelella]
MRAIEILEQLLACQAVVGRPNGPIVETICEIARKAGAQAQVLPGPEGDRSNLWITLGPKDRAGYVLSGHMDVVPAPAKGWTSAPFTLRDDGAGRLYGRGTSDMQGFLACCLAVLPATGNRTLSRPLHLAFSYDEEAGCRGVPHLLAHLPELCALPLGCIIGEPSDMTPILAHKGKAAVRLRVEGLAGHSSRPDLGRNAIHGLVSVLNEALAVNANLPDTGQDVRFAPACSTLQVGVVSGGVAVNVIPDLAEAEIELRAIPGQDPLALLAPVKAALDALRSEGFVTNWEVVSAYPALSLAQDSPLSRLIGRLSAREPVEAVSFGTEGGLYQLAGIASVICGPGHIERAHKPDEFVTKDELAACERMIAGLVDEMSA